MEWYNDAEIHMTMYRSHKKAIAAERLYDNGIGSSLLFEARAGALRTLAGDHQINFQHYVTLYETEKNKQLRVVTKLTRAHVAPDNLRKMSVCLATQVTKDLLALLNTTERNPVCSGLKLFASQMTTEAMRVTLLSTLGIIEYLFGQGAHYILTAKLNQDPLEHHFGLVRSFRGDESHPTVVNFTQIFRLLSLYTPIKIALRGSVEGAPSAVLVGVQDTLRRTKEDGSLNKVKLRDTIEARMRDLTTRPGDSHQHEDSDHVDLKGEVDESILYYLSGHKFTKTTTCSSCTRDISSTEPVVGKDAYLTI
ncbi:hypothetical protein HPB50_005307 [Hyalomma asiaticum]|uniref:Uncharacterized protein n=1 Tax=Hyalomma asiaticum TaxID=266040 RepID=A0ACB7RM44_HYAAI|nr:hypothetical protein HPB50_005307 [Hyalomma asiaticum]